VTRRFTALHLVLACAAAAAMAIAATISVTHALQRTGPTFVVSGWVMQDVATTGWSTSSSEVDGADQIAQGTLVTVTDASTRPLASAYLHSFRHPRPGRWQAPFVVREIPAGRDEYWIRVANNPAQKLSREQVRAGKVTVWA
jgi:hypothetical protein